MVPTLVENSKFFCVLVDSLIAINSLSLAACLAMNKGQAAKLKLLIAIRESIHVALLRIKFVWHL